MSTNCDVLELISDCGKEFDMSTVMQCVQKLKAWQESEEQKLCDNSTTYEVEDVLESFHISDNVQENHYDDVVSSYSEIDEELLKNAGYQKRVSSPVCNSQNDIELLSPNKNVGETCNAAKSLGYDKNNIAEDNQLPDEKKVKRSKKPFLKRGTGLARYGLNLNEVKKKTGKLKFHKPIRSVPLKAPRKCLNQVQTYPKTDFVNKPIENTHLNLNKIKETNSWNRYEPKDMPNTEENHNNSERSELNAFEILEERANNSNLSASSPTVRQLLEKGRRSKCNKAVQASSLVRSLDFNGMNSSSTPQRNSKESEDSYSDSSQECDPLDLTENFVKHPCINGNKQNNLTKAKPVVLTEKEKNYVDNYAKMSGLLKNINLDQSFDTEILSKRLEQLESEIETFRAENIKLIKLQREFEVERQKFFKNKDDFMKKMDEEKKKEDEKMAEERKKFTREKMLFEKNARELRNKPNRQEREEIKKLNDLISALKEEFNKKESRWATGQARLRTQMRLLESSNTSLRSELELFKKTSLNKKVVTFKTQSEKQALRNTKTIHNVNAELSKLTLDNVSSTIDSKTKKVPAPILRKSSVISSDENQTSDENPSCTDDENDATESDGRNSARLSGCDVVRETILDDGRKEILYSNGNLKKISADGVNVKVIYYNGDVKESREDSERYYFAETKTYHTTYNTGLEIIEFPNGQTEKHYKDGKVEIEYVDGKKHTVYPDSKEVWNYLDGSVLTVDPSGRRELVLLNGQREIHTNEYKKRVYPDGTSKIVYPDGSQETKYPDGRIRKKDKDGNLTLDTSISS